MADRVRDGSIVTDRIAGLRADIERAPQALIELLEAIGNDGSAVREAVDRLAGRRVMLVGLGSSRYAAAVAASAYRAAGATAWVEYASVGPGTPPARELAVLAISASGRTPEVVASARRHHGTGPVIAVTNRPDSPLASAADVVLPLHAGDEQSGIATLTFRATLALLGVLSGSLRLDAARSLADRLDVLGGDLGGSIDAVADLLDGAAAIDVLAESATLGMADQAALLFREAPRLAAHAAETGDWLHTEVYLALPGHRAMVFAGSSADDEVAATITRRGGQLVAVGSAIAGATLTMATDRRGADGPFERTILESLVADRLALALWERAHAEG